MFPGVDPYSLHPLLLLLLPLFFFLLLLRRDASEDAAAAEDRESAAQGALHGHDVRQGSELHELIGHLLLGVVICHC